MQAGIDGYEIYKAVCVMHAVVFADRAQEAKHAEVMGHNWVLSTDADFMPVATAAAGAGLANNYVPVGDDRVLAATAIIGGGEETSVTFSIENLSAGNAYTFFCSFPGHYAIMKGSFKVIA